MPLNVKYASHKDVTYVMSVQLHVDVDITHNLNHFPLLEIMIIET